MVVAFNKDLLSWYLITRKLNQNLGAGLQSSSGLIESPSEDDRLPSDTLQIDINSEHENLKEEEQGSPEYEWMISVREKLKLAKKDDVPNVWEKLCIYKVPHYLRDGEDKAYTPNIVSLGPYHHGKECLQAMELHKWRAFYQILKRGRQDAKLYLDSIKKLEERARACYEGQITMKSNDFVEMMVLDGCFVLELFRGAANGFTELGYSKCDPVFAMRRSMHSLQRDMIMLENQIPLFILNSLLDLQIGQLNSVDSVAKLALQFFDPLMPALEPLTRSDWSIMQFDQLSDQSYLHCLQVFRQSLLRRPQVKTRTDKSSRNYHLLDKLRKQLTRWIKRWSRNNQVANKPRPQLIHSVTELKEAGIKFKRRKTDRFWDIEFKNGFLKIPQLLIHDGTKSLFQNLIAFEQSHLDCENEITSYVIFMDNLINSQEDVGYLRYCGIFEHWLGSDADVANLFNGLCQDVVFYINDSYLSDLSKKVNRFYNHRWNSWRASLMHNYFNSPWAIISIIAAVILLILTSAQTFYGVYGYYKSYS